MILHPAVRYLVLTRWKNRIAFLLRKARTPGGVAGALVILAVLASFLFGVRVGEDVAPRDRGNTAVAVLGFLLVTGVLSGIGQRGLVFLRADLDYLFPTPVPRRQLLLYHFVPHYLFALVLAAFLCLLGGRFLPHPWLFALGVVLCQATASHLSALTAELSMVLGDRIYGRLRNASTVLLMLFTAVGMLLLIGSLTGAGDVSTHLHRGLDTGPARVLLFPAHQAARLGSDPDLAVRLTALVALAACAAVSFLLVVVLRVDFVEASFTATKKAWRQIDQRRRGVGTGRVKRSARGPRTALFRGPGAVLWLNLLTMRRQLRSTLGGLLVVAVMLAVFGGQRGGRSLALALLSILGLVPLWMPLPIGFRLPREQLLVLRELPHPPARLATALLSVAVLVPFLLQSFAVAVLTALGRVEPVLALTVLPLYAAVGFTLVGIESIFVLRRPHPNALNLVHQVAQLALQAVALTPALVAAGALRVLGADLPTILLCVAGVQGFVVYGVAWFLGRRLQVGHVATA